MTAARKIITGFTDLRTFPHALAGLTARGNFGPDDDGLRGVGGN